jgi:hypothetical protein
MKEKLVSILLRVLFYPFPNTTITKQEEKLFEDMYNTACTSKEKIVKYNLQIPKYKFLNYISRTKNVIFHGSNTLDIREFEPRDQTLFDGTLTKSVFATKDWIWPVFYAVFRRTSLVGNFRNGCISADGKKKYHFYSLSKSTFDNDPWTNGMLYILPSQTFTHSRKGIIQFDEWTSNGTVKLLAKIEVVPSDFYYFNRVSTHDINESLAKTWLLYKIRNMLDNTKRANKL